MENNEPRPRVKLPEAEAVKLAAMIRGRVSTMPLALSVFAFISNSGVAGLNIQVDHQDGKGGVIDSVDYNYKASEDPFKISRHVLKRITSRFDL